ncbi:casparian strip membrane protein 2-like [Typha angustifolia]|uniref:casparian strip membrane protein 2-like n=1 Tax=Typha angustifolia TaxID=59011 RepID=UPI003C2C0CD9
MSTSEATVIPIAESSRNVNEKAPLAPTIPPPPATATNGTTRTTPRKARFPLLLRSTKGREGWKRCLAVLDFLLRVCAFAPTLAAAITMGTTDETLPFFTEHFQFHTNFADFPALTFFVVGNAIAAGYLVLSLPLSIVAICRPQASCPRLLLLIFDLIMVALTTAAASAAAAIVYLAHTGNTRANWIAICLQFESFCERTSGAVVGSFIAVVLFMLLVLMSALALRKC